MDLNVHKKKMFIFKTRKVCKRVFSCASVFKRRGVVVNFDLKISDQRLEAIGYIIDWRLQPIGYRLEADADFQKLRILDVVFFSSQTKTLCYHLI